MFERLHFSHSSQDPVLHARRRQRNRYGVLLVFFVGTTSALLTAYLFVRGEVGIVQRRKTERAELLQGLQAIIDLNRDKEKAEALFPTLMKTLPTAVQVPTAVLPGLSGIAGRYALGAAFRVTGSHAGGPPGVDFEGRVNGSLKNLSGFLTEIESGTAIIQVSSLSLSRSGTGFQAVIVGTVYTRVAT